MGKSLLCRLGWARQTAGQASKPAAIENHTGRPQPVEAGRTRLSEPAGALTQFFVPISLPPCTFSLRKTHPVG